MATAFEKYVNAVVHGAQERYVSELTALLASDFAACVRNPDVWAAHMQGVKNADVWALYAKHGRATAEEARKAFLSAMCEEDDALVQSLHSTWGKVGGKLVAGQGVTNHVKNVVAEAARGFAEIVRRQNVALASTAEARWYQVTADAVTARQLGRPLADVLEQGCAEMAAAGVETVDYKSGAKTRVDAALRRHAVTQWNQARNDVLSARMDEYGLDLVMVSSHFGARPSHAAWQGRVYSRSGKGGKLYPPLAQSTGYGTVGGLCGANCRHTMTPYIPGVSKKPDAKFAKERKATGKTSDEYYADTQRLRAMERRVRDLKREVAVGESQGLDMAASRAALKAAQKRAAAFSKAARVPRDYSREKAYGVGEQPRGTRPAPRVVTDGRKAVDYAPARVYEGTRFTDTLAGAVGKGKARDVLDGVYKRLSTCKVKGLAKLWGDTFHDVSVGLNAGEGAYYSPGKASARFAAKYLGTSAAGEYSTPLQTVFHEVGHATDNRLGGGMRQVRAMTGDGELGRIIFSDWADVASAKAKERTAPLRAKLAEVRARAEWDADQPGSELLDAMVGAGVATGKEASRAKQAAKSLRRWTMTLGDEEWAKARAAGIGNPDWVIATPDKEKRKALPPDVYDLMKLERPPDAQKMLASAESGGKASKVAVDALRKEFEGSRKKSDYADMSDWVECLAGRKYPFGSGHGAEYWSRRSKLFGGGAKGAQKAREVELSSEAWAELCDSALANQSSYELLRTYFPNAVKWFEDRCEKEASR